MVVTGYSLAVPYKNYDMSERVAVVTSRAFVGATTNRVGPRPARPTRPKVGLLADLEDALGLDLPPLTTPTRAPTPTRSAPGRKTGPLHRRLSLALLAIG